MPVVQRAAALQSHQFKLQASWPWDGMCSRRRKGREGRRQGRKKGGRETGRETDREGGREGGKEEGKEGRKEEGREGGREAEHLLKYMFYPNYSWYGLMFIMVCRQNFSFLCPLLA